MKLKKKKKKKKWSSIRSKMFSSESLMEWDRKEVFIRNLDENSCWKAKKSLRNVSDHWIMSRFKSGHWMVQ